MAYYNDADAGAVEWLKRLVVAERLPSGTVDERDIRQVQASDVSDGPAHFFAGVGGWPLALRLAGVADDAPVWTGSCPCQPFSQAGRRRGTQDERHLWPEWRRLVAECKPAVLFGEQVASPAGRAWLAAVRADLEALGYAVGAADLCAAGIGAPHLRQRLFFVAHFAAPPMGRRGCVRKGGLKPKREGRRPASIYDGCARSRMEHPEGSGAAAAQQQGLVSGAQFASETCRVAVADGERREGECVQLRERETRQAVSEARGRGTPGWDDVEWIPCGDGKLRPAQPGTFPLAHGVPGRLVKLRGYGNAIVPALAADFVKASLEAIEEVTA